MTVNTHSIDLELSSGQYGFKTDTAALSLPGPISGEIWMKMEQLPSTVADEFQLMSKVNTDSDQVSYVFQVDNTDILKFQASDNGTVSAPNNFIVWDSDTISFDGDDLGVWIHVGYSFDIATETVKFYRDTVEDSATKSFGTNIGASIFDGNADFTIGARETTSTPQEFFDGKLNNGRMWSDVRTQSEFATNWKKVLTNVGVDNLVDSWYYTNSHNSASGNANLTAVGGPSFSTDVPFVGAGSFMIMF